MLASRAGDAAACAGAALEAARLCGAGGGDGAARCDDEALREQRIEKELHAAASADASSAALVHAVSLARPRGWFKNSS